MLRPRIPGLASAPPNDRPRIGIYEPGDRPSGPSRYVDAILAEVDPDELEVVILGHARGPFAGHPSATLWPVAGGEAADSESGEADESHAGRRALPIPRIVSLWAGFARESRRLARALKGCRLGLLHTQNTGCEESAVAARLAGVPRVLGTFHVDSTYDLDRARSGFRHRVLEHLSNHSLDRAIAVSEATKLDWVQRTRLPGERVCVIPNGVDAERFRRRSSPAEARAALEIPAGSVVLGCLGRLEPAKGFGDLLQAISQLGDDGPPLTLVIAGRGPLRESLGRQAESLGLGENVRFLGFREDVRDVLEASDVFVLPSWCEAMPFALLEAMAMGLPAIGTSVGGVPEAIHHSETGLVVPARDPAALARAIRTMRDSSELRHRMGEAGRERVVRHFSERRSVRRTIEVYRDLLRIPRMSRCSTR